MTDNDVSQKATAARLDEPLLPAALQFQRELEALIEANKAIYSKPTPWVRKG